MGKAVAEDAGRVSDAHHTVQRARVGTEAYQSCFLRSLRHSAGRSQRGVAGKAEGIEAPDRDLLAKFRAVGMGGQGNSVFP